MIVETQVFFAWPTQYLDNINSLHSTVDSYYYYVCGCLFSWSDRKCYFLWYL